MPFSTDTTDACRPTCAARKAPHHECVCADLDAIEAAQPAPARFHHACHACHGTGTDQSFGTPCCNCRPYHRIDCPAYGEDNRRACVLCGAQLDEPGDRCVGPCANRRYQ